MTSIFSKVASFFKNNNADLSKNTIKFEDIGSIADLSEKDQFLSVIGSCSLQSSIFSSEESLKGDAAKVLNFAAKTVEAFKKSKTISVSAFKESVLNFGDEKLNGWADSAQFIVPVDGNIFSHYVNSEENSLVFGGFSFKDHKFAFIQFQIGKDGRRDSNQAYISPYFIDYEARKASGINVRLIDACDSLSVIKKFESEIRVVVLD